MQYNALKPAGLNGQLGQQGQVVGPDAHDVQTWDGNSSPLF